MPASYSLLCAFIGKHKGLQSGNTIRSWMSGLRSWHVVNHAPWYGDDEWVQLARVSANKEGTKHKKPLRAPVSIEHLSALLRVLDLSNPFHAAVFAIALCTFFACRRLGETTVTTAAAFDEQYNVLRSTVYVSFFMSMVSPPDCSSASNFVHFVTVLTLRTSASLGRKPLKSSGLLLSSRRGTTLHCALLQHSKIILPSTHPFLATSPSSPT